MSLARSDTARPRTFAVGAAPPRVIGATPVAPPAGHTGKPDQISPTKGTMTLISLPTLHEELRAEAEAAGTPLARRHITAGARLQQLAIWLPAGGVLPEHGNPGEARLHILSGQVRFIEIGAERTHTLVAGDLFAVPDALHRVEADTESLLLLSFVPGAEPHTPA